MISVITPVHSKAAPFLRATFESLVAQTHQDWEWVTVTNNGGCIPADIALDPRVKIFPMEDDDPTGEHNRIGRLKRYACLKAVGEIYVELDADDILVPTALEEVLLGFSDPSVAMVYSNSADFKDTSWEKSTFGEQYGWRSRPFFWQGHELNEMIAWPASPHMMRYVFWAPNHIRAWLASAYNSLGGHDESIKTGDDHELCCRFYVAYGARGIKHIDKCLYLYRLHGENSCVVRNDLVQEQTTQNYLKYSRAMAIRWAKDQGTDLLDLGGRINAWDGFTTVDLFDADVVANLEGQWPFDDNSVGVIRASHVFEHLRDPIHAMNEAFRVLAPGGWLLVEVPSTDGRGAFQDPTHVSFWNENSIWYYTKKEFSRFIPAFKGRFQNSRTVTYFPSEFERENNIPVVQADLIAVKGAYAKRPVGEVLI